MNRRVGVWIDHQRATIIWICDDRIEVEHIESGVECRHRLAGGTCSRAPWGQQDVASDGRMGERRRQHVEMFLDRVCEAVAGAGQVLLLGRGMLKSQLGKRISGSRTMAARLAEVVDTERMSERQIVVRVRRFYGFALQRRGG